MPENYLAMFDVPPREKALEVIRKSENVIEKAANLIKSHSGFPQPDITVMDRVNSGIVNDIFYPAFVHAKKFYATGACISCGKCVKLCQMCIRDRRGKHPEAAVGVYHRVKNRVSEIRIPEISELPCSRKGLGCFFSERRYCTPDFKEVCTNRKRLNNDAVDGTK